MLCYIDIGLANELAELFRNILRCNKCSRHMLEHEKPVETQQNPPAAPNRRKLGPQHTMKGRNDRYTKPSEIREQEPVVLVCGSDQNVGFELNQFWSEPRKPSDHSQMIENPR